MTDDERKLLSDLISEYELRAKYNDDVRDYKMYSLLVKIREKLEEMKEVQNEQNRSNRNNVQKMSESRSLPRNRLRTEEGAYGS